MTSEAIPRNVLPLEAVDALRADLGRFAAIYGDALLLVRLDGLDTELAAGLAATALRGAAVAPTAAPLASLEFHTVVQSIVRVPSARDAGPEPFGARVLAERLEHAAHFLVPLRKRPGVDTAYADRISVGRARNKDIVLRDGSVSKFHAWFEKSAAGLLRVADAGSKNATRVNGRVLGVRELTPVRPGDLVTFGSVETAICSPRDVLAALR